MGYKIIVERNSDYNVVTAAITGWTDVLSISAVITEGAEKLIRAGFVFSKDSESDMCIDVTVCGQVLVLKQPLTATIAADPEQNDPMAASQFLCKTIINLWAEKMPVIMRANLCRF